MRWVVEVVERVEQRGSCGAGGRLGIHPAQRRGCRSSLLHIGDAVAAGTQMPFEAEPGDRIEVAAVLDGGRLRVRRT